MQILAADELYRFFHTEEEEVKALRGLPERIAFDVEDHVSARGRRQELKAAARIARNRMPIQSSRRTPFDLERGLA